MMGAGFSPQIWAIIRQNTVALSKDHSRVTNLEYFLLNPQQIIDKCFGAQFDGDRGIFQKCTDKWEKRGKLYIKVVKAINSVN